MFEGCTLLANLFGFEFADARLRPYVEAAEQQQESAQRTHVRRRANNPASGQTRARSRR